MHDNGNYKVTLKDPNTEQQITYVTVSMFSYTRKIVFIYTKVSRPVLDFCELCFRFNNRFKYFANHSSNASDALQELNPSADESLF